MRQTKKKLNTAALKNAVIIAQATSGKSIKEIAAEHGRNRKWLSVQLNHEKNQPIFSEIYSATIAEAEARLPDLVKLAFDVMERTLTTPFAPDRNLDAAKAILNMASKHWQPQQQPVCQCRDRDEKIIQP